MGKLAFAGNPCEIQRKKIENDLLVLYDFSVLVWANNWKKG